MKDAFRSRVVLVACLATLAIAAPARARYIRTTHPERKIRKKIYRIRADQTRISFEFARGFGVASFNASLARSWKCLCGRHSRCASLCIHVPAVESLTPDAGPPRSLKAAMKSSGVKPASSCGIYGAQADSDATSATGPPIGER